MRLLLLCMLISGCVTHLGCLTLYNKQQYELMKYRGKGVYECRPIRDTTLWILIREIDMK